MSGCDGQASGGAGRPRGATVAVLGSRALLRLYPRPVRQRYGAMMVRTFRDACAEQLHNNHWVSAPNYRDLERAATQLQEMTGSRAYRANLVLGDAEPFQAPLELVLDNYFDMLGVQLRSGRSFTPEEAFDPEAGRVAVLSEALWRSHFGADPNVMGTRFKVNRYEYRVIGVVADGATCLARPAAAAVPDREHGAGGCWPAVWARCWPPGSSLRSTCRSSPSEYRRSRSKRSTRACLRSPC